jgi:hypothetical protein
MSWLMCLSAVGNLSRPPTKKPQGLWASGFVFLASSVSTNPYGLRSKSAKSNKGSRFVAIMTGSIRWKNSHASTFPLAK